MVKDVGLSLLSLLEKLYQWILQQEEERSRLTPVDIQAYIQNEIECELEDPPVSPRVPSYQHPQVDMQLNNLTCLHNWRSNPRTSCLLRSSQSASQEVYFLKYAIHFNLSQPPKLDYRSELQFKPFVANWKHQRPKSSAQ
ncbi:hypothetical protein QQ045_002291 [Rhodiola kirilowii]